jgi:flagellar motor switch/type III secretory pathway protein FliN
MRSAGAEPRAFSFTGLPPYSREEAALTNWLVRAFPDGPGWIEWVQDAFAQFLERPAGLEVRLTQRHSVDPTQGEVKYAFTSDEIVIGRDPQAGVCLPVRSVASRHACLSVARGRCFLEDLGSSLGTYVNKIRLAPKTPCALVSGDCFDVFPYSFEVQLRQLWEPDSRVEVEAGNALPVTWAAFQESAPRDRIDFPVDVTPGGAVCFEASQFFLEQFLLRLLLPLGIVPDRLGLDDADSGFFELLVTSLAARVNWDLSFPFQAAAGPLGARPDYAGHTRGLAMPFTVRILGLTGVFRLFLPFAFMAAASQVYTAACRSGPDALLSWAFPVSAGHVDLTMGEVESLERGDVVLYTGAAELLIPGDPRRGWAISAAAGNLGEARIDNYFEGPSLTNEQPFPAADEAGGVRPDLGQLPVRLHIILGEKEMTLAEANALVRGSILALDLNNDGAVQLAVNGKIVGEGRLVEIEGRLGVRILSWRTGA